MHSRERQRGGHEGVYLMQTISLPVFTCSSSFFLLDSCRLGFFFFFFCPSVPPKSLPPTLLLLKIYKVGTARSGSCWEKTISWKWLKATQSRRLGCWFSATASHYYRKSFASVFVQQKAFSFFSLSLRKVDYNSCFSCELPSEASKVRQRMRVVLPGSAVVTTVTALVCEFKDRLIVD